MFKILKLDGPDGTPIYVVYDTIARRDIATYDSLEEAYRDLASRRL